MLPFYLLCLADPWSLWLSVGESPLTTSPRPCSILVPGWSLAIHVPFRYRACKNYIRPGFSTQCLLLPTILSARVSNSHSFAYHSWSSLPISLSSLLVEQSFNSPFLRTLQLVSTPQNNGPQRSDSLSPFVSPSGRWPCHGLVGTCYPGQCFPG